MSFSSSILALASQTFPRLSSRVLASSGYTTDLSRFGDQSAFSVWNDETAERQDRAWQPIVESARVGKPREDVLALQDALKPLVTTDTSVLEVGCGGGYNSEIIAFSFPSVEYTGLDLSAAMIEVARKHYPDRDFEVGSAYSLPHKDRSVDIVLDGVALLHMPGWRKALPEYARVAKSAVILHGLTLTDTAETTEFAKYAYGQPALEYVFNRAELLAVCTGLGMTVVAREGGLDYDLGPYLGIPSVSETWVLSVRH